MYYAATRDDAARSGFCDADLYKEIQLAPADRTIRFVKMDASSALAVMREWQADAARHPY